MTSLVQPQPSLPCNFRWVGTPKIPLPPGKTNRAKCVRCGFVGDAPQTELCRFIRACKSRQLLPGDRLARLLARVGITPERWAKLTGRKCGCKERQAWLNRIRWLNNVTSLRWWLGKARPVILPAARLLRRAIALLP